MLTKPLSQELIEDYISGEDGVPVSMQYDNDWEDLAYLLNWVHDKQTPTPLSKRILMKKRDNSPRTTSTTDHKVSRCHIFN